MLETNNACESNSNQCRPRGHALMNVLPAGASLKLSILNPKGRVWTMVAGGGASVIYADTVGDLGYAEELGNYAEYSGAPNTQVTFLAKKPSKAVIISVSYLPTPRLSCSGIIMADGVSRLVQKQRSFWSF